MPRNIAAISPEVAKAVLKEIGGKSLPELARELERRGTPVSLPLLREWRRRKWRAKPRKRLEPRTKSQMAVDEAVSAGRRIGLPTRELVSLAAALRSKSGRDIVGEGTRQMVVV